MASERGGYKRPTNPSSYSGVGKNSKRTDGRQAIKSPNVQDSTDLQVNDRERIIQGQKIAPLSETPSPRLAAPTSGPATPGGQGAVPPEFLFSMPGPDAPGAIPEFQDPDDDKEFVLQMLAGPPFNNQKVAALLSDMRASRAQAPAPQMSGDIASMGGPSPEDLAAPMDDLDDLDEPTESVDLATEGEMGDEEVDQTSVETSPVPSEAPIV